jgi:hypothetical protein
MRSQVQVLAGPPPIVAGQSTAGSESGALAAGWGRAGAARLSRPTRPVAPSGPPTRAAGSPTTTHRGRAPSPRTASHAAGAATSRCSLLPCPQRGRRAPHPDPAARVRHRPPSDQRDRGSVARVPASATVDRAVDGPAATGASTRSGGHGRPASSTWSPPPPPEHGRRRTRPDGADTERLDTGRLDTGRLDTGRVDSRRPSAGLSGRRPQVTGQRTAGQPDPGRRNRMGGHRMLDTGDRRRGLPAGSVDHGDDARALDTGWTLLRADVVWASDNQDGSAAKTPRHPRCYGRAWPLPRP